MDKQEAVFKMLWPDKCWHEVCDVKRITFGGYPMIGSVCTCGYRERFHISHIEEPFILNHHDHLNPDLTTWAGFGMMWQRAQECEWWVAFHDKCYRSIIEKAKWDDCDEKTYWMWKDFINPTRFMEALYDFGVKSGRIK